MEMLERLTTNSAIRGKNATYSYVVAALILLLCFTQTQNGGYGVNAADAEGEDGGGPPETRGKSENPVAQVRYRTRPVAAFRSGSKSSNGTNSSTNSSETEGPEPSGVPFFAVHDLSSQTFEKLQENWRNLESFIRNLQARRSQDESQRSSTQAGSGGVVSSSPSGANDNHRRAPPYNSNNVFTFKYHPVVLEGEGSTSVDDIIGGNNNRGTPIRNFNGISHFSPYPFDPKDEASKNPEMERHTIATIYTIGICLTIMAIGSVMFILINKCDGTSGNSYMRTMPTSGGGSRVTRSALLDQIRGAGRSRGRDSSSGGGNGRSRSSRRGGSRGSSSSGQDQNSGNVPASANTVYEADAKILTDLPPSYDSLFPEGVHSLHESSPPKLESCASGSALAVTDVSNPGSEESCSNSQNENAPSSPPTGSV